MSALAPRCYFTVTMLHRTFTTAFKLHGRTPGRPAILSRPLGSSSSAESKTDIKIEESTEEYTLFVEPLIPRSRIPAPPKHDGPSPSGWVPPSETPPDLPYMIRRSRMHNIPVYTDITSGSRKTTLVRKVEGDIWALEKDIQEYLKEVSGKDLPTQVNEVTMTVRVKGHFDTELKAWLSKKGF